MMKAMGTGRFVKDPELREVPTAQTCVCNFSLAINEQRKVNNERKKYTHFFDFVIWDKAAEVICKYCKKGDMLEFLASPRQEKWQDEEGNPRSKVTFRIDDFKFISTRNKSQNEDDNDNDNDDPEEEVF